MDFRRILRSCSMQEETCAIQIYILNQNRFREIKRLVKNNKGMFCKICVYSILPILFWHFSAKTPNFTKYILPQETGNVNRFFLFCHFLYLFLYLQKNQYFLFIFLLISCMILLRDMGCLYSSGSCLAFYYIDVMKNYFYERGYTYYGKS